LRLRRLADRPARSHEGGGLGIGGPGLHFAVADGTVQAGTYAVAGARHFLGAYTDGPTLHAPTSPAGRGTRGSRSCASAHAWACAIVATRRCWAGCAPTCTVTRRCWSA